MRRILLLICSILLLASCDTKEPVTSKGSFTINGSTHSFSSLRIDHVGYEAGDSSRFILRLTAFPGTFSCDTVRHSGYGTVMRLFFIAEACDIFHGTSYTTLSADSLSEIVTIGEGGDTISCTKLTAATVAARAADHDFLHYDFTFATSSSNGYGDYTGKHTLNRTVDQPSCGLIEFDTISTHLASGSLFNWGSLFGSGTTYYEFIFYSTNSRFNDDGKLRQGVQFSLGIISDNDGLPSARNYDVAFNYAKGSVLYGHKVSNASWGTYWTTYYSGSVVGKANILTGTLLDFQITGNTTSFSFNFTDQLDNTVTGHYQGPFILR